MPAALPTFPVGRRQSGIGKAIVRVEFDGFDKKGERLDGGLGRSLAVAFPTFEKPVVGFRTVGFLKCQRPGFPLI